MSFDVKFLSVLKRPFGLFVWILSTANRRLPSREKQEHNFCLKTRIYNDIFPPLIRNLGKTRTAD